MTTHHGSCHCGGVRIAIDASADVEALECNCSMCQKLAFLHLIVPAKDFRLEAGAELLTTYTFNTGVAKHTFCSRCGVKPFYVPRSNPDGFSVNVRCLDRSSIRSLSIKPFDGQNWEQNAAAIAHLSN